MNASNIAKDFDWMQSNTNEFSVVINDHSDQYSLLALQGPTAEFHLNDVLKQWADAFRLNAHLGHACPHLEDIAEILEGAIK